LIDFFLSASNLRRIEISTLRSSKCNKFSPTVSEACPESKTELERLNDKKRQFSDLQVELDRKNQEESIPRESGRTSRITRM
jgi:hypothetical protein